MPPVPFTAIKRSGFKIPPDKPCKRCYAPMTLKDGVYVCAKHGPDGEAPKPRPPRTFAEGFAAAAAEKDVRYEMHARIAKRLRK